MEAAIENRICGSLFGGAIGDAFGYPVEFMSLSAIRQKYGKNGIVELELNQEGKAVVSDDTQMTLFTANGLLFGVTRWATHGVLGADLQDFVLEAYKEWYQTQTKVDDYKAYHTCWIRDIKELNEKRAPGNTCLSALSNDGNVSNNSKGCGGIMRVAPVALFLAAENERMKGHEYGCPYPPKRIAKYGGDCAALTHKHPLGYTSAALFVHLLYQILIAKDKPTFDMICGFVENSLTILSDIYTTNAESKAILELRYISNNAIRLARQNLSDDEAISILGEGWVAEETWAIALFCTLKHLDSFEDAIVASVNHDGDSDSTGAVCGNLIGAILGYDAIPEKYKENIELKEVIVSLAGDILNGCHISEYHSPETNEEKIWEQRYVFANPYTLSDFNLMTDAKIICQEKMEGVIKKHRHAEFSSKKCRRFTPDRIVSLDENEVFVFGSNLAGSHGGGAARLAYERFGAVWGLGTGIQGQSYAIPTMQGGVETIKPYVDEFLRFTQQNKNLTFLVTKIGCGIAGFRDDEIAPLFYNALALDNVILPKEFVCCLENNVSLQVEDEPSWDSNNFLVTYLKLMKRVDQGEHDAYYKVKELRTQEYRNTIEIVNQGFYTTERGQRVTFPDLTRMEHETKFYNSEFNVSKIPSNLQETKFFVRNADCIEEGMRLAKGGYNPAILNMASRRIPGGGVLNGAGAQEETLFRRTNLFRSLYQFTDVFVKDKWFYKYMKPTRTGERYPLHRDYGGIYTPNALVFREDEKHGYKLMDKPERMSFISVAGINRPELKDATHLADSMINGTKNKIRTILRIGLRHGHDSLVLGALGCGAFCNPPSHIAKLFHEVFEEAEFKNKYLLVCFAILDDHNTHRSHNPEGNYKPFANEFCKQTEGC